MGNTSRNKGVLQSKAEQLIARRNLAEYEPKRQTPIDPVECLDEITGKNMVDENVVQAVADRIGSKIGKQHDFGSACQGKARRVVLYSRCSVAKEGHLKGTSVARQAELSRNIVERDLPGAAIIAEFQDDGISGKYGAKLKDLKKLMQMALQRGFDVLVVENVDRIGRTAHEVCRNLDLLVQHKISIVAVHGGPFSPVLAKILAVVSEAEWEKISTRVRDSRRIYIGQQGRQLGLKCYGYDITSDDKLQVNEIEASRVRELYDLYGRDQIGVNQICKIFEAKGYAAPGGGDKWSHVTLIGKRNMVNGAPFRTGGLLCQPTYVGRRMSSVIRFVVDEHGRSTRVIQDPENWQFNDGVPRILSDEQWAAVQARLKELDDAYFDGTALRQRSDYIFSGLLRCGVCGDAITLSGGCDRKAGAWEGVGRLRCRGFSNLTCDNDRTYNNGFVTEGLLRMFREWFAGVRADEVYRREFLSQRRATLAPDERDDTLAQIERQSALLKAYHRDLATGRGDSETLLSLIGESKSEKDRLQAKLAQAVAQPPAATMTDVKHAARFVTSFDLFARQMTINVGRVTDPAYLEVVTSFRRVIETITISPKDGYLQFDFDVRTVLGNRKGSISARNIRKIDDERSILKLLHSESAGLAAAVACDNSGLSNERFLTALDRLIALGFVVTTEASLLVSTYRGDMEMKALPILTIEAEAYHDDEDVPSRELAGATLQGERPQPV